MITFRSSIYFNYLDTASADTFFKNVFIPFLKNNGIIYSANFIETPEGDEYIKGINISDKKHLNFILLAFEEKFIKSYNDVYFLKYEESPWYAPASLKKYKITDLKIWQI